MRNELDGYPIAFQNYIMQHPEEINRAGDISAAFTEWQLPTVNGQQYYSAPDQSTDGTWASTIGNSQITLPDGRTAIPNDIATSIAEQTNQGDWLQNILNSSLPVMALGGALGAYGAFGPQGFAGNLFGGAPPAAGSPPSSYWSMGAEGAGTASDAAPAAAGSFGGEGGGSLYGANAGGANLYDIPGLGNVDLGSLTGGAGSGDGLAGAFDLTGPLSTGEAAGGNSLFSAFNGMGLPPGSSSILQALGGGGGGSDSGGFLDSLKSAFPNANLGSALTGLGQGLLGYLGSQQQTKALSDMQDKYLALGAPYRDKLAATYQPGYSVFDDSATKDAATRAADVAARSYSATSGNPFDQPSAQGGIYNSVLSGVALPQLNTTRSQLGSFGQLGINTAGTAGLGAAQQAGGGLDAVGYGLGTALNGQPSIQDLLKQAGNYKFTAGA